jgi:hypothetical protein
MRVRSFEPLARKIVQVLMVFFRESVEGDGLVGVGLGVFANMAIFVTYALAARLLPITIKALFDAWPAIAEVEGLFEGFDMVFVEFSRGIVGVFQELVCHPERKISPAGGIALQLYKDTCIGLLDILDVEEREIFETLAKERKAVEDFYRVFIRLAKKRYLD